MKIIILWIRGYGKFFRPGNDIDLNSIFLMECKELKSQKEGYASSISSQTKVCESNCKHSSMIFEAPVL